MNLVMIAAAFIVSILLNCVVDTSNLFSFPFEGIGLFLRSLSLNGTIGNIAAWIIYIVIALIPICYLLYLMKNKKNSKLDYMNILLSIALFYILYMAINPNKLGSSISSMTYPVLGLSFYSLLIGYLALKMIYDENTLTKSIKIILYLLLFVFAFSIVSEVKESMKEIVDLKEANQVTNSLGEVTYSNITTTVVVMWIRIGINVCENLIDLFIITQLLKLFNYKAYSDEITNQLNHIYKISKISFTVIILANMASSIIQLLLIHSIKNISITASFSIFAILFVLVILLFTRFYLSSKELKEENDMFI